MPPASGWSDRSKVMAPKPVGAERSRKGRSHLLFAVEHADRMRTVTELMPRWRSSSPAINVRNAAPALCHLACHSPQAEDRSQRPSRPRLPRASGHLRGCIEACPYSIPPRLPAEGHPAGPAIPRGRRPGRPSSGPAGRPPAALRLHMKWAGLRAGYARCPLRGAAFEVRGSALRAASGMVSRGLVTTSFTASSRGEVRALTRFVLGRRLGQLSHFRQPFGQVPFSGTTPRPVA